MKLPKYPLPHYLSHKPVYALFYYDFDGPYAGNTDAMYITLGLAQYNPTAVSFKIWRYSGKKWSRQSEELPLHRVIDGTIMLAHILLNRAKGLQQSFNLEEGTFYNQEESITMEMDGMRSPDEINNFNQFLDSERDLLVNRLESLGKIIDELRTQGVLKNYRSNNQ